MSKTWNFGGMNLRPTPSARKNREFRQSSPNKDMIEKIVRCKLCGFYVHTDRDASCPFCETSNELNIK